MLEGKGGIGGGRPHGQGHEQLSTSASASADVPRHRPLWGMDDSGGGESRRSGIGNGNGNGNGNGGGSGRPPIHSSQGGNGGAAAAAAATAIGREEAEAEEVEVELEMRDPVSSSSSSAAAAAAAAAAATNQYSPPALTAAASSSGSTDLPLPDSPPHRHYRGGSAHAASPSPHAPHPQHHHRPLEILYHISPASALSCLPVFLLFEARRMWSSPFLATPALACELLAVLVLGGAFSFLLILAEIKLVKISSSLTMSMFGAVKEVITVALSMIAFHDAVSALNVAGLVLAIGGAAWYRSYKLRNPAVGSSGGSSGGSAAPGWAPSQYLPAASGIFNLEDDSEEEEEEENEAVRRRGGGHGGMVAEQELRAMGRGRDVGLA